MRGALLLLLAWFIPPLPHIVPLPALLLGLSLWGLARTHAAAQELK